MNKLSKLLNCLDSFANIVVQTDSGEMYSGAANEVPYWMSRLYVLSVSIEDDNLCVCVRE